VISHHYALSLPLTINPPHRPLIRPAIREMDWVDQYNRECLEKVGPLLQDANPQAFAWLQKEATPLSRT
jgi:hypothetical protein